MLVPDLPTWVEERYAFARHWIKTVSLDTLVTIA